MESYPEMYCRHCAAKMAQGAVACPVCGRPPLTGKAYCPTCGEPSFPDAVACPKCGTALDGNASAAPTSKLVGGVLLNILFMGVGYFYIGQNTKGILFTVITFVLWGLTFVTCGVGLLFYLPYGITLIVDTVLVCQRLDRGEVLDEWKFF